MLISNSSEYSPLIPNPMPFSINDELVKETGEETGVLDPLTIEKKRLKKLPGALFDFPLKTFALNVGDSFLAPKVQSFALSSGDAFIQNTGYEGQDVSEQVKYWLHCWQLWEDPDYIGPCHPNMDEKMTREIIQDLVDFQGICGLFKKGEPKEICQAINKALEKKQQCIIPLKTHPAKNSDGHVFACVFEKNKTGQLTATILNVGGGAEVHPLIEIDTHEKSSFMFPPIIFHDDQFFKDQRDVAEHFIHLLCSYAQEPELASGYEITEIYRLFLELGAVSSPDLPRDTASISQRAGTCPAETLKSIHRFYFLKNYDLNAYKKIIFFVKFQFFFDRYCQLRDFPDSVSSKDKAMIKRSVSQFAYSIEKYETQKMIEEHRLLSAKALLELISEAIPSEEITWLSKDRILNRFHPEKKALCNFEKTLSRALLLEYLVTKNLLIEH